MRPNTLSDVKKANKQLLYECIKEQKQITIAELEHVTQLSRPTIVGLIHELELEEKVMKVGRGISNGGRTPALYGINANAAFALGIDMELPAVRMAVSDLEGNLICSSIQIYPPDSDRNQMLALLLTQIEKLLTESQIDQRKLLGIGMGVPGIIDRKNNYSVRLERVKGWEDVPIGAIVEKRFGCPVFINNDVNLLAWAEQKLFPTEGGLPDLLYISIRIGIGMAVWMDGKLLQGERGNAGRLGHMLVNTDGPACTCGSRGCLGLYTGERAMRRIYREFSKQEIENIPTLMELVKQGDSAAQKTLETAGYYLGIGIANVANLFDISHVVVLSTFDSAQLLDVTCSALEERSHFTLGHKVYVTAGKLEETQYALGGCLLVLEQTHQGTSRLGRI